jgi:hypothetical protein
MFTVLFLWAEVEAQRCAATLPVGETWGSKGQGGRTGGGHPPKRGALIERASARALTTLVVKRSWRGSPGIPVLSARVSVLHPCPREGRALSNSLQEKCSPLLPCIAAKETQKSPASGGGGAEDLRGISRRCGETRSG